MVQKFEVGKYYNYTGTECLEVETKVRYEGGVNGTGLWEGKQGTWSIFDTNSWTLCPNQEPLDMHKTVSIDTAVDTIDNGTIRTFATGATRDTSEDKLDFEGFFCPKVMTTYAEYMHKNRIQTDGSLRDSDNWQKGIPEDAYMKSMFRHFMDTWKNHRGIETPEDEITNLCATLFNVMGLLHEKLKKNEVNE